MVEPVSTTAAAVGVLKAVLQGVDFIKGIVDSNVISAMFGADGTRLLGNSEIEVVVHTTQKVRSGGIQSKTFPNTPFCGFPWSIRVWMKSLAQ